VPYITTFLGQSKAKTENEQHVENKNYEHVSLYLGAGVSA